VRDKFADANGTHSRCSWDNPYNFSWCTLRFLCELSVKLSSDSYRDKAEKLRFIRSVSLSRSEMTTPSRLSRDTPPPEASGLSLRSSRRGDFALSFSFFSHGTDSLRLSAEPIHGIEHARRSRGDNRNKFSPRTLRYLVVSARKIFNVDQS